MRKIMFFAAAAAGLLVILPRVSYAQADIEIGKTTIRLQSPVKVYDKSDDDRHRRGYWQRSYVDVFAGFSFPVEGCSYEDTPQMPVKYGNSFEITVGAKQWYRPARHYAFGISVQYTHYDYRARNGLAASGVIAPYPVGMNIYREIFKTDNIGLGIYNRFFFSRSYSSVFIDIGAYGDWPSAVSTRSAIIPESRRRRTITATAGSSCLCREASTELWAWVHSRSTASTASPISSTIRSCRWSRPACRSG